LTPRNQIHFWDGRTASYSKIAILYNKGPKYDQEDVVWHAWGAICAHYFPQVALNPTSERWSIDREAYRGNRPNPSKIKPDLVIKKLMPAQPQQNLPPQVNSRDFIWIECKPATKDIPSGWKNVLGQATKQLQGAHPNREVFLMIAIGWRFCSLYGIPTVSSPARGNFLYALSTRPDNPG
jgi:hypothetical protein